MAQHVDVEFSRHRVALFLQGVKNRFEELKSRDFPNSTPAEVIKLINEILDLVEKRVSQADEKLLPLIFDLLKSYQTLLGFLDNAHTEQTPRGLICILRELLHKISEKSVFFASPQVKYNYGIADVRPFIMEPLDNLLDPQELKLLPAISNFPIRLILFPRAERDNILAHAVFGHEIGHILADKFLKDESGTAAFKTAWQTAQNKAIAVVPAAPSNGQFEVFKYNAEIGQRVLQIRKRAMEELISDYVGTLLFGPSALLASYEILAFGELDSLPRAPRYYPAQRYRLRLVFDTLKDEGFVDAVNVLAGTAGMPESLKSLKAIFDRVEALVATNEDITAIKNSAVVNVAYDWVVNSLNAAKIAIKQQLPKELIYSAAVLSAEIPELIERLTLKVPPSELGIYPNISFPAWQSALLSGWAFSLHGKASSSSGDVDFSVNDHENVRRLILRAIETIDLQQEYAKYIAA